MIHMFSMSNLAAWSRGEFKVQIQQPGRDRPIAYCDGTEADLAELRGIAEAEGAEMPTIHRRVLKTGREIWTLGELPPPEGEED